MGGEQSALPNQLEFLNCLLEQNHNTDHKYWVQLMKNAIDRKELRTPDSLLLNEIAYKFPANFVNIVLASAHEVCSIENLEENITPEQLNQLELALRLFTSCASIMVTNPGLAPIFEHLDKETFHEMLKISNQQLDQLKGGKSNQTQKDVQTEQKVKQSKKVDTANETDPNASQKVPQKQKKAQAVEQQTTPEQPIKPKKKTEQPATPIATTTQANRKKSAQAQTTPTTEQPKKKAQQQPAAAEQAQQPKKKKVQQQPQEEVEPEQQVKPKKKKQQQTEQPAQVTQTKRKKSVQPTEEQPEPEQPVKPKKKKAQQPQEEDAIEPEQPVKPKTKQQQTEQISQVTQTKRKKSVQPVEEQPVQPKEKKQLQEEVEQPVKPKKKKQQQLQEEVEEVEQIATKKKKVATTTDGVEPHQKPKKKVAIEQTQVRKPNTETQKNAAVNRAKSPQPAKKQSIEIAGTTAANRAASPQPQRAKRDPQQKKFIAAHRAMRAHDGHVISDFSQALIRLLFKEGVTLDKKRAKSEEQSETPHYWIQSGRPQHLSEINTTRADILASILVISSLHIFSPSIGQSHPEITSQFLDQLPIEDFINSTCRITFRYMNERPNNPPDVAQLVSTTLALMIRLFTNQRFQEEIAKINPQILLSAMYVPLKPNNKEHNLPLFCPLDPLAKESLSFLYICALFQKNFVALLAKRHYSNLFLYHLIWAAQLYYEKEGVNYIHSIILSTILLIVADPNAASKLNEEFDRSLELKECKFQPPTNGSYTYGDLLLEVLLNFCQREAFLPSLICVFHMIAPHVNTFSILTATRTMSVFEKIQNANKNYISLFLEVFATIVQQKDNSENGFCPLIVSKGSLFKSIQPEIASMSKSLPVIMTYVKKGITMIKKQNKPQMGIEEIGEVLAGINTEKLFPTPQLFVKHPHIFGGEIEKTWDQWADLIVQFNCQGLVQSIKRLRSKLLQSQ